jgi:hypothetical protein
MPMCPYVRKYKTTLRRWFSYAPGGVQYARVNRFKGKCELDSYLIWILIFLLTTNGLKGQLLKNAIGN